MRYQLISELELVLMPVYDSVEVSFSYSKGHFVVDRSDILLALGLEEALIDQVQKDLQECLSGHLGNGTFGLRHIHQESLILLEYCLEVEDLGFLRYLVCED